MRPISFLFFAVLVLVSAGSALPARADEIILICRGDYNAFGSGKGPISPSGSLLDIRNRTFNAPVYGQMTITGVADDSISLSSETDTMSVFGSLDRISGHLSLNAMSPMDRQNMQRGQTGKLISMLNANCAPAKKLF